MKYLPLRDFDTVTEALNFSTPDCHVIGGCDVYTTKAAGGDKKLYKNIENSLESQYASLVRASASLSPPYRPAHEDMKKAYKELHTDRGKRAGSVGVPDVDLSRASPFGPLSQINARRTFAYLIATLNASHPDYDFSSTLRPSDFRKERSLTAIMNNINSTLANLRPRHHVFASNAVSHHPSYLAPPTPHSAPVTTAGTEVWSPCMWTMIDKEMALRQCERYSYKPDEDPFEGEEGAIWSEHYFFFNKERKRVCYLHLRGLSVISHSPVHAPTMLMQQRGVDEVAAAIGVPLRTQGVSVREGAGKRASYWLGNRDVEMEVLGVEEDEDDDMITVESADDEVDVPHMGLDDIREDLEEGTWVYAGDDFDEEMDDRADEYGPWRVRGWSEDVREEV